MSVKIKRLKNKVVDAVLHLTVTVMSSIMSLLYRLIKSAYSLCCLSCQSDNDIA